MLRLPKPPSDRERFYYVNTRRFLLYVPGVLSASTLLLGMWLFVFAHPGFWFYGAFVALSTIYLSLSYIVGLFGRDFDFSDHLKKTTIIDIKKIPTIDIFLPCCGEPYEVLSNTYKYVTKMVYPRDRLKIYILDDKNDMKVQELAYKFGLFYLSRPNLGENKKAGNLRYAFRQTNSDFFVVFDADFCPHPKFLLEIVPYLDDDVAIVQTPQFFSVYDEQSWVEKGAGYIQELFYRLIQVSRDHFHAPICVGSNAIYRRAALEPFGGTALIDYSEDVHTGFMVTDAGWRVKYIPVCLARGICPNTLDSFFVQQYRWATGSLSLCFSAKFWVSKLTIWQKCCYLSGMLYYLTTGLGVVLTVLPSLILVWFYPHLVVWFSIAFSLPSFIYGMIVIPMWTKQPWGWYAPRTKVVASYANLFALVDKVKGKLVPWQVSGAGGRVKRFLDFRNFLFYWTLSSSFLIYLGVGMQKERILEFLPMLFFTTFHAWLSLSVLKEQ